jgi:2-hydroxy-3-oxopropionate reductase
MNIGFIGLGTMGRPMVGHLLKAGHTVRVWSRRAASADFSVTQGAECCESPAAVARASEIVCTNVFSDPDVEALAFGADGLAEGFSGDCIHVDFSTISPGMARLLAARYAQRGIEFVDAPVTGGGVGAEAATLAIMWGGKSALAARLEPIFNCLGKTVVRIGEAGDGQVAKACNQMIMVAAIQACAEAAHLANAAGVDFAKVRDAMLGGSAGSRVLDLFGGRMARRDFQAGVVSRLHHKDYRLLLNAAAGVGAPLPVSSVVCQQLNATMAMRLGDYDTACLLRLLEAANGCFFDEKEVQ